MKSSSKKIIVTGSSGQIGQEIVNHLLNAGFIVIGVDKIPSERREIISHSRYKEETLDISKENEVEDLFSKHSSFHSVVNNAGIGVFTPFFDRTKDEFFDVVNVNLFATFLMCKQACRHIVDRKTPGKIVNIASLYGVVSSDFRIYGNSGRNNSEVYSMTKAGVVALTKYLATHFGHCGVVCNSISPGGVFNNQSADFIENYEKKTPLNRMANPQEIAGVVEFLIGETSSYINGENIIVDGGFSSW